ncbi:MAG: hypothetical protein BWZ00_01671 [Bacteroidetes bacterium ADurb.BinA174]|nr:MAG: hypothetical protein BWZ00_01671 [Bacteroidetes bacterium ADurb.BinA174]
MSKKTILSSLFAFALVAVAAYGINKSINNHALLSDLALANIEALAHLENGCDTCHLDNYGREPKVERCKLDLGGGMFTSSVKRICEITADASRTCTPVECGGYF